MTHGFLAHRGYWLLVGALSLLLVVMVGSFTVLVLGPELHLSGFLAVAPTPSPSSTAEPTASPIPSGLVPMGAALVPADADCAGCHTGTAGAVDQSTIPVMAHPMEGWSKCTNCHESARLVDTAPGHTGIHATECTICHRPGDLRVPLSRPHRANQNRACLDCHGGTAPLPSDMVHRRQTVCWLCHRLPTIEPPVPAHETAAGESDCRTCHTAGGRAGALPSDHVERPATLCLSCHEVTLGASPGTTPRIQTWPNPSASGATTSLRSGPLIPLSPPGSSAP
jgi:hypothetical protein